MRQPIKSDKHEVTWSNLAQDAGTAAITVILAQGVASADKNTATECEVGSHVRSIYLEMNISAETLTNPKVLHWELLGIPPNTSSTPAPNLYYQTQRAYIFKRGMEMLPRDAGTVYKRIFVAKVPKKFQRIAAGFILALVYQASSTEAINNCGFVVYKEFY